MKAIRVRAIGGPEVLELCDIPEPQPGPGYEDSDAPPPEPPRARKIAPLHAWVVAQLATLGSGAR